MLGGTMENVNKGSNTLIKTIMFIIVVALSCLLFFGLGDTDKTGVQLVSFGFIIFAELVIYVSTLLPSVIKSEKITSADIISCGVLYAIAAFLINIVFSITEMRPLVVFNIAAILAYLLLFAIMVLMKKK
jgi:hypothetical protein